MTARLKRTIHVGCKQLGIDNETRRDLQLVVTGKSSMSAMNDKDLQAVIDALTERGFKPGFKGGSKRKGHPPAPTPALKYIHVLWGLLGKAGVLEQPNRKGLNAFIRSQYEGKWQSVPLDIDMLRDAGQINDVTRALKDWCKRKGIPTERGKS